MSTEITNGKIQHITSTLQTINSGSSRFKYFIIKNLNKLKVESEIIKSSLMQLDPDLENDRDDYSNKRTEILTSCAKKNEDGSIVKISDNVFTIDDQNKWTTEIFNLDEQYKHVMFDMDIVTNHNKEFLSQPNDFEFYKFDLELVPDDLSLEQMDSIFPMIND